MPLHVSACGLECPVPNMQDTVSSPDNFAAPAGHILFVDDDMDVQKAAALLLHRRGLKMSSASNPDEAWSVMAAGPVDVVLLDLNFTRGRTNGEEGFRCLGDILAHDPDAVVVVITGHSGVNVAVAAMRGGASDFVMKPWSNDRLVRTLETALVLRRSRMARGRETKTALSTSAPLDVETPILGDSPAIQRVRAVIGRVASTDAPVMIYGEAGTGKSLIARHLHLQSKRASGPFLQVDLAALTAEDAEATLFGADQDRPGALASGLGGTVFLDEIGALPSRLQGRLLTMLETGRLGLTGVEPFEVDVRFIAATRRPRDRLTAPRGLLHDLFYRLNTVEIKAAPLHEMGRDALLLAEHFLRLYANRYGRPAKTLTVEAQTAILENPWPGNVRALRQTMERCVIFAEGERYALADLQFPGLDEGAVPLARPDLSLAKSERAMIADALKRNSFNVSQSARQLGLTRAALYRRMAKHGL
jgi:DNA-binding NtrC family response regulator